MRHNLALDAIISSPFSVINVGCARDEGGKTQVNAIKTICAVCQCWPQVLALLLFLAWFSPLPTALGEPLARCDASATLGYCREYNSGWSVAQAEADCAGHQPAAFATAGCPRMNVTAECRFSLPAPAETPASTLVIVYYSSAFSLEEAAIDCPGTLLPPQP